MAKAMGVIPAEKVSTDEDAGDIQNAVGNVVESVTTLLQALDGTSGSLSSKISQESINKLYQQALQLLDHTRTPAANGPAEEDTDRMAAGMEMKATTSGGEGFPPMTLVSIGKSAIAEDPWVLEATPKTFSVSRRVIASSGLVRFLERRRMLERVTLVSIILAVAVFLTYSIGATKVKVPFTNKEGEAEVATFWRPYILAYVGMLLSYFFCLWLLLHRMNQAIFIRSLLSFDGIACAGCQICYGLLGAFNMWVALGSKFDPIWMICELVYRLIQCCLLAPIIACMDGLRYQRKILMGFQCLVLLAFMRNVVALRCTNESFPEEEVMVCTPSLLSLREIGQSLLIQATVFIAKSLFAKFGGSTFGIIHPQFVPSSQAALVRPSMVDRASQRISCIITGTNDMDSASVPPEFKGVELEGSDDSAPESFTKPATSSGDCEDQTAVTTV